MDNVQHKMKQFLPSRPPLSKSMLKPRERAMNPGGLNFPFLFFQDCSLDIDHWQHRH